MAVPNISLAQFNKIATGDYNAGIVDFKTDDNGNVQNALRKVNHHVHKTGENNVVLSSERILEVKEAFIQALRGGGVDEASINEVRAKLGIPTEVKLTTDKNEMKEMMAARIRPLTRQYVRVLLDRYASGGVGRTAESLAAVSPKDFAAARKTAAMSGADKETRITVNRAAIELAKKEGDVPRALTDSLSLLSTKRKLSDLLAAQHRRCKGENAVNEKNLATVALQTNFATLFKVAYKMHTANAQESETFHLFGLEAKLVKGEDGMLSALLGTGDLQTKVALGENAEMFFSRLVGRTVFDMETLGAPTVKNLLNEVYSHDLEAGILASDRTSVTRQFACLVLENKVDGAFNLCKGNYNTGVLVEIAERVLTNNEEPIDTKAKLDAYHAKLVRDNAGLPEEMKAMLEQVANVPLGAPDDDHSEFKVSSPLAAGVDEVQQAIPPPPEGPPPIVHHDIGMAGVKDFVADLVFSDDTMVADVVVNRPGELLRKALSTDRNLTAIVDIIKNPDVLDFALATPIAGVVKEGFAKIAAILSEAYLAQSGGETLAEALARPEGMQRFANFFRDESKLPGATIAKFDAIIQTMANKGCEKIQGFINTVFKVDTANANVQGALTTDPYKDMTPEQIKAELDKKSLNQILDSASTSDAPGQVGFFRQVISTYFTQLAKADKRSCFAAAMRYADTFEFGNKQGKALESANKAALNKFTGAILKGTSPLLQKMMQGLPKEIMGDFADALADMKTNLAPIPRKVVQAHLMNIINSSNGKIKSIELEKSLGAASVGEAFLCKFKFLVTQQKTEIYEDPNDRFLYKSRPVFDSQGKPVMEEVEKEKTFVVKLMRHDAEIRVQREAEIFTEAAKKIPGMDKTWEGQLKQYMTEFDFRTEAENINTGVELYDIKGGANDGLEAIAPNVTSMKLSDVVPPQKNVLVAQVAVGKTVDSYFKEEIGEVRNAASSVFERDETTNRIKWEDKVVNAETGETKKVPVFRPNIPGTAILNLQSWLSATYNDLRSASGNILQATKVWFYEAIFGSGKFHGDTHSGNLMIGRNDITFIDFGNLYQLKSNRADGVNERHELVRVIMGAAFRDKDFVLAGFEKLLSPEGKAALAANRKKAEAILDSVLSKSKGGFSFNIVYRLQAAVAELQKLGLELPPQINCFIQSLVRLSNSVVEINTIMNQCKAMLEATQTMVRPPAPLDDLDLIGKIFNEFASEAGQKLVPQPNGRKYPAYIVTLMSDAYGGATGKPGHAMFKPGGEYHTKVLNSIKNAANPLARAEELYNKLVYHADRAHNPLQDVQIQNNLDPAMKKFREDWPNARTPQEKDAVIKAFTDTFARSEAGLLQYMMLYGRETARTVLGSPKTFASAITDILFDEFDALSEGLDEKEEGKLKGDVYFVATGELGLGYWDALKEANILNALMNDAQKMGGDKDYKVDIGV